MRTLHRHQYELRDAILGNVSSQIGGAIVEGRFTAAERVDIYRNHYRFTLIEALKATFPVVQKLVGDNFFAVMAWRFISRHPPSGPVLLEYGSDLSRFIDECEQLAEGLPYLADVARLEWALNLAYHADDAAPVTLTALADIPPDRVGGANLTLHPSLRVVRSPYPIDAIWRANQQPDAGPAATIDLDQGAARLAVYRRNLDVEWRSLTLAEDTFLEALAAGVSLETAHEAALALGEFALPPTLAWTFEAGLFSGISPAGRNLSHIHRSSSP